MIRRSSSRWLLAALAVSAAFAIAGCGGDDDEEAAPTPTTTAEEVVRAGLVSDVGRFNDKSFNQSALEGLRRAESELGAEGRPIESRAASDYLPNLSTLARENFDVTIAVGFLMAEGVNTVANRFPDSNFAIVDYSVNAPPFTKNENVQGLIFASNEAGCLVGHLAAKMVEQQGGAQVISAIGGIKLPTVDIFIAGYRFCAQQANAEIRVLVGYSQDFVAQDKCKEVALNQIAQGSQVVFQVAGGCGLGALDAAKQQGKWGIGVDRDQSDLGSHILTSAVKRVDTSVFETIKAVQEESFQGGTDALFNLENEGVDVGEISEEVPQEFIDSMEELKQQIIDGELEVPSTL